MTLSSSSTATSLLVLVLATSGTALLLPAHAPARALTFRPSPQLKLARPQPATLLTPTVTPRSGCVSMQEAPFWENVVRFARFFITTVSGLILGLLSPFSAFMRTPTLQAIGSGLLISVLVFLYVTLQAMQGSYVAEAPPASSVLQGSKDAPRVDASMKRMLSDIYGDEL